MKLGIIISALIVIVIAGVLFFSLRGTPDPGTRYSAPKMLEARSFGNLPPIVTFANGDASAAYEDLLKYYQTNRSFLESTDVTAEQSDAVIDLFIKAHEAGTVNSSFLDKKIAMAPNAQPDFGPAFSVLAQAAMKRAVEMHERPNPEQQARAEKAAKAAFAVGLQLYERSNRVPIRTQGLMVMQIAGTPLYKWSGKGNEFADNMVKWTDAINSLIDEYWDDKSLVVFSLRLNTPEVRATVGDVLKYAKEDKDLSWRIEATLALGRVKFMPSRGKGNDSAILDLIETLKSDKDPQVAAAAAVAERFTKDDVRALQ